MRSRYKTPLLMAVAALVGGCAVVSMKHLMSIEKERAQAQRQRGLDTVEVADSVLSVLPQESPAEVVGAVRTMRDMAQKVEKDAARSERWHTAGEKIMGPPPTEIEAGSDEELAVLAQTEREAETLGKVRTAVETVRALRSRGPSPAPGGGYAGLLGILGGPVGIAAVAWLRKKQKASDKDRDEKQDEAISAVSQAVIDDMREVRGKIDDLAKTVKELQCSTSGAGSSPAPSSSAGSSASS